MAIGWAAYTPLLLRIMRRLWEAPVSLIGRNSYPRLDQFRMGPAPGSGAVCYPSLTTRWSIFARS